MVLGIIQCPCHLNATIPKIPKGLAWPRLTSDRGSIDKENIVVGASMVKVKLATSGETFLALALLIQARLITNPAIKA
jgi:hypothetical protein